MTVCSFLVCVSAAFRFRASPPLDAPPLSHVRAIRVLQWLILLDDLNLACTPKSVLYTSGSVHTVLTAWRHLERMPCRGWLLLLLRRRRRLAVSCYDGRARTQKDR